MEVSGIANAEKGSCDSRETPPGSNSIFRGIFGLGVHVLSFRRIPLLEIAMYFSRLGELAPSNTAMVTPSLGALEADAYTGRMTKALRRG